MALTMKTMKADMQNLQWRLLLTHVAVKQSNLLIQIVLPPSFESAKVQSLIEKAITDRTEITKLAEAAMGSKVRILASTEGSSARILTWNKLLSGHFLRDSQGATVKTSQAMRLYQLRDYHARSRLEAPLARWQAQLVCSGYQR